MQELGQLFPVTPLFPPTNITIEQIQKRTGECKEGRDALHRGKVASLQCYCQAITFYLLLKAEGLLVREHPVVSRLMEIKNLLDKRESEMRRNCSSRKSNGTPMKALIALEMSKEVDSNHSPTNVVAKLMGLEALPQHIMKFCTTILLLTLKEGVGALGDLTFTDNSSWIKSRKFRLGLKVASGYCDGIRIREAKTKVFTVKDYRGECENLCIYVV